MRMTLEQVLECGPCDRSIVEFRFGDKPYINTRQALELFELNDILWLISKLPNKRREYNFYGAVLKSSPLYADSEFVQEMAKVLSSKCIPVKTIPDRVGDAMIEYAGALDSSNADLERGMADLISVFKDNLWIESEWHGLTKDEFKVLILKYYR